VKLRSEPRPTFSESVLERVRLDFVQRGESIADWSRERGFDPDAVYQVLSGRTRALRGKSHHIAVALGIKPAPIQSTEVVEPVEDKGDRM